MAFVITYRRLFTVEILHSYFLDKGSKAFDALDTADRISMERVYSVSNFFSISPTRETAKLLKSRGLIFRADNKGFYVGVRIEQDSKNTPEEKVDIFMDDSFLLRFKVKLTDPFLFNYTALPFNIPRGHIFYFNNQVNNFKQNLLHLSKPLKAYNGANTYLAGELVVDDEATPTQLFECIRTTTGNPRTNADWQEILIGEAYDGTPENYLEGQVAHVGNSLFRVIASPNATVDPPDPSQWQETPISHQYVSSADAIRLLPNSFTLDFTDLASPPINVQAHLIKPGATDPHFSTKLYVDEDGNIPLLPTHFLSVDLGGVNPGAYTLVVKDKDDTEIETLYSGPVYVDPEMAETGAWAVIDIVHKPGEDTSTYRLLEDATTQQLRTDPLKYTLRFKNRHTFWRYIFNRPQPQDDVDLGEFERDGGSSEKRKFKTKDPKPLTTALEKVLKFNDPTILLPNPEVNLVKPNKTDNKIYSEIYINS